MIFLEEGTILEKVNIVDLLLCNLLEFVIFMDPMGRLIGY